LAAYVAWQGRATGYDHTQTWWAACLNGVWQTPVRVSTSAGMEAGDQQSATIAADANGGLHIAWCGPATGYAAYPQIWYAERLNGAWQAPRAPHRRG
jgi:hypothetical protein